MVVNYNQTTLSIVIYGEVQVYNKLHTKGTYFICEKSKVQMLFSKKSLFLMLNHREIEDIMKEYELYYTKKSII